MDQCFGDPKVLAIKHVSIFTIELKGMWPVPKGKSKRYHLRMSKVIDQRKSVVIKKV